MQHALRNRKRQLKCNKDLRKVRRLAQGIAHLMMARSSTYLQVHTRMMLMAKSCAFMPQSHSMQPRHDLPPVVGSCIAYHAFILNQFSTVGRR